MSLLDFLAIKSWARALSRRALIAFLRQAGPPCHEIYQPPAGLVQASTLLGHKYHMEDIPFVLSRYVRVSFKH